jgi:hypothetical protein
VVDIHPVAVDRLAAAGGLPLAVQVLERPLAVVVTVPLLAVHLGLRPAVTVRPAVRRLAPRLVVGARLVALHPEAPVRARPVAGDRLAALHPVHRPARHPATARPVVLRLAGPAAMVRPVVLRLAGPAAMVRPVVLRLAGPAAMVRPVVLRLADPAATVRLVVLRPGRGLAVTVRLAALRPAVTVRPQEHRAVASAARRATGLLAVPRPAATGHPAALHPAVRVGAVHPLARAGLPVVIPARSAGRRPPLEAAGAGLRWRP